MQLGKPRRRLHITPRPTVVDDRPGSFDPLDVPADDPLPPDRSTTQREASMIVVDTAAVPDVPPRGVTAAPGVVGTDRRADAR